MVSLWGIRDKTCVFYRADAACAAGKTRCFLCEYRQNKIEDLGVSEHLTLVAGRYQQRLSFYFSATALLISAIALLHELNGG